MVTVRGAHIHRGTIVRDPIARVFESISEAREYGARLGLFRLLRRSGDPPTLVETWWQTKWF